MAMSIVQECRPCKPHPFQDKKYGTNKRVFTRTRKQDGSVGRCTVCGTESNIKK